MTHKNIDYIQLKDSLHYMKMKELKNPCIRFNLPFKRLKNEL